MIKVRNDLFLNVEGIKASKKTNEVTDSFSIQSTSSWVGIHQHYFIPYGGNSLFIDFPPVRTSKWWVNDSKYFNILNHSVGICGTLSATALLAYYDDNVDDGYIPNSIRTRYSVHPGTNSSQYALVFSLYQFIDKNRVGTMPWQVSDGINNWRAINSTNSNYDNRAISTVLASPATITSKIDSGRPILVGLLTMLGSSYKDHWVLSYQYRIYHPEWIEYRVVDNHGQHAAVINSTWAMGTVRLNR